MWVVVGSSKFLDEVIGNVTVVTQRMIRVGLALMPNLHVWSYVAGLLNCNVAELYSENN